MAEVEVVSLTAAQQAIRATRVGASEVGACLGIDPFCSRYELWHRKNGTLPEEDLTDNDRVFWGTILEPAVAEGVAIREGWKVRKVHRDSPHPSLPFLGASLDYEIVQHEDGPGALEIKTADRYAFRHWPDGLPPLRYQLQLQTQLACTGRKWGAIAVLVGGNDLHVYRFPEHEAAIARVCGEVSEFWRSLEEGREPQPDWQADADVIARLYATTTSGKAVDLSDDQRFNDLCRAYALCGKQKGEAEKAQKAIKAEIVTLVGDAETAIGNGCRVTARNVAASDVAFHRRSYRDVRVTVESGDGER